MICKNISIVAGEAIQTLLCLRDLCHVTDFRVKVLHTISISYVLFGICFYLSFIV